MKVRSRRFKILSLRDPEGINQIDGKKTKIIQHNKFV